MFQNNHLNSPCIWRASVHSLNTNSSDKPPQNQCKSGQLHTSVINMCTAVIVRTQYPKYIPIPYDGQHRTYVYTFHTGWDALIWSWYPLFVMLKHWILTQFSHTWWPKTLSEYCIIVNSKFLPQNFKYIPLATNPWLNCS